MHSAGTSRVVYSDVIHNWAGAGRMDEGLGSNSENAPTSPLLQAEGALPSAPPAYESAPSDKDDVGKQPQAGQPVFVQQPVQPVLMGQPAYGYVQPGQPTPVQPVVYTFQGAQPFSAFPRPSYPPPHSHLALALTTMIICAILNVTSLSLGVPALVMAMMASGRIDSGQWKSAKTYSNVALYLSISNWIYTLSIALVILGSVLGAYFASFYYRY